MPNVHPREVINAHRASEKHLRSWRWWGFIKRGKPLPMFLPVDPALGEFWVSCSPGLMRPRPQKTFWRTCQHPPPPSAGPVWATGPRPASFTPEHWTGNSQRWSFPAVGAHAIFPSDPESHHVWDVYPTYFAHEVRNMKKIGILQALLDSWWVNCLYL